MFRALSRGLLTTLRFLFTRKVTVQYPEVARQRAERFRGRHILRRYADGLEMCVGCELCQAACPANAITVIAGENDPAHPHSPGERYAAVYEIDMLRCIFCGLCEEACPTEALHLTREWELADTTRRSLVYGRDRLISDRAGEQSPPENVYPPFRGRRKAGEAS